MDLLREVLLHTKAKIAEEHSRAIQRFAKRIYQFLGQSSTANPNRWWVHFFL